MSFKDLFSKQSGAYARFRPNYPEEIFRFAASLPQTQTPANERIVWDCATGNGQAALGLASHFSKIIATDASEAQLRKATSNAAVEYRVAPAESSGFADASVDLVSVAQALHWFRIPEFFAEARRVLKPGGGVLVFGYEFERVTAEVDPVVRDFEEKVDSYWAPERRLVEARLQTIEFPFEEIPAPQLEMVKHWTLAEFEGYVGTWSSTQKLIEEKGMGPLEDLDRKLRAVWGDPESTKTVRFDLFSRAGRV